ncbi:MAG: lipopolysaccharide assembly protein LapA domain-containing protein [Desulfovibrionales bacterium]
MRYLKVLALILFFFVGMVFFVQNTEALSDAIQLRLNLFHWRWISIEFPYYLLILIFFVIGALFSLAFFLAEKIRLTKQLRACNHTVQSLQQELNSLRNLPLDEERYPAEEPSTE